LSSFISILDTLDRQAREKPNELAFALLKDSLNPAASLTYKELREQVASIAGRLQTLAKPGERVVLLYAQPLDFVVAFLGCLYAGLIGIPTPLPNSFTAKRVLARMQGIFQDARPSLALTTSDELPNLEEAYREIPHGYQMQWIATDELPASRTDVTRAAAQANTIAYLQYTSGSTSTPKGVMMTHANIMHQTDYMKRVWIQDGTASGVSCWMPYYHDFGLFTGTFFPLRMGIPSYLMSPVAFIRRPELWLDSISHYRLSHTAAPPFAFDLCVRKLTPDQRARLDLSSLRVACLGAEPIHPGVVEEFTRAFQPQGFSPAAMIPAYGLAEATLVVTASPLADGPRVAAFSKADLARRVVTPGAEGPEATALVSSGRPLADVPVRIVNEATMKVCAPNQIGEIWVGGPSVAAGYWEKEEENKRVFQARLADSNDGPYLRTGDLGFFHDGLIYIAGRIKDIMIFQGQNFYPQDIEWTAQESHPALQKGGVAAYSVEVDDREQMVVTQELASVPKEQAEFERIASAIRKAVAAEHGLSLYAVVLIRKGTIPKTSSGKIQRHAARADFLSGKSDAALYASLTSEVQSDQTAPKTELETALAKIFAEVLKVPSIGVEDNFFERGGDSLGFLQLMELIEERLGLTLPFERPVDDLSVRTLARILGDEETEPEYIPTDESRLRNRLTTLITIWNNAVARVVPYNVGHAWSRFIGGWRLTQRLFFSHRVRRANQALAALGQPAPSRELLTRLISNNILNNFRTTSLSKEKEFSRHVRVTGLEYVERALSGHGVMILHSHFGLDHLGMFPILEMKPEDTIILGGNARTMRLAGLGRLNKQSLLSIHEETVNDISRLSFQLAKGKRLLVRGGILIIAADGYQGMRKLTMPFLGRLRPFGSGFAEVALSADADVIPVFCPIADNGDVEIVFHPPLIVAGANREEQTRSLIEQYASLLESYWKSSFSNVKWLQMRKYIESPPV